MIVSVFNSEGAPKAEKYSFRETEVTIGRNPTSQSSVVLNSQTISRNHLQLRVAQGRIQLQDLASSNGTFLNSEQVTPKTWYAIQPTDRVKLAEFQGYLQFQIREGSTAAKRQPLAKTKRKASSPSSSSSGQRSRSKEKAVQLPFKISESTFRMLKDMTINKKSKEQRIKFLRLMGISKAGEYWEEIEKVLRQKKGIKDKQETVDNLQRQFLQSRGGQQKRGLGR